MPCVVKGVVVAAVCVVARRIDILLCVCSRFCFFVQARDKGLV